MIVEFVGGPNDGSCMEVIDGTRHLNIAQSLPYVFDNNPGAEVPEVNFQTAQLEIQMRKNGTYFVVWTERLGG